MTPCRAPVLKQHWSQRIVATKCTLSKKPGAMTTALGVSDGATRRTAIDLRGEPGFLCTWFFFEPGFLCTPVGMGFRFAAVGL